MKNFIKHKVILVTIFMLFSSQSLAGNLILPLPKPSVDEETKKIVLNKKNIYPQKKPLLNMLKTLRVMHLTVLGYTVPKTVICIT